MSFDQTQWLGTYESLNFTLAAYSLNGTFLGFEQLTDQFQWCKKKSKATVAGGVLENADGGSSSDAASSSSSSTSSSSTPNTADTTPTYGPPPSGTTRWLKHGTSFSEKYWCDLDSLVEMPEPKFYDVYIVDKAASTSASLTMYPVPIRVLNYGGNTGNVRDEWFCVWAVFSGAWCVQCGSDFFYLFSRTTCVFVVVVLYWSVCVYFSFLPCRPPTSIQIDWTKPTTSTTVVCLCTTKSRVCPKWVLLPRLYGTSTTLKSKR